MKMSVSSDFLLKVLNAFGKVSNVSDGLFNVSDGIRKVSDGLTLKLRGGGAKWPYL